MNKQRAFTLVELSIVLVIIGLLVGGVLTGQSLIRAAELRSVTSQYSRYQAAVMTFRDKYFALPGDMTNAQSYWGVANATAATCITTSSTTSVTCNGDGNGLIDVSAGSNERFRFWQHLANAGLIEGSYTGVDGGSNGFTVIAANSPVGRISSSIWYATYWLTQSGGANMMPDGVYGNTLEIGAISASTLPAAAIFKPEEAYNIDTKMDDGKPASGRIVVRVNNGAWASQTCTDNTSPSALTMNYLLSTTAVSCDLVFRQAF